MFRIKYTNLCLFTSISAFAVISKIIFDKVNLTSQIIVDEEFHLPLGEAYCNFEYNQWHPKVTTLPGLYVLSSFILGPWQLCSTYFLRLVSQIFSLINIYLFYWILSQNNDDTAWKNIMSALNLALLPPLYFFSHVYYTDVASLTMILTMFILAQKGNHYVASIFGLFSILFRQTNIIWVGMVLACYIVKEINSIYHQKRSKRIRIQEVTFREFQELPKIFQGNLILIIKKTSLDFWLNTISYCTLLQFFAVFVYFNGGIVVGDKTAHEPTLHVPQIFYFSLFTLFFAWPYFLGEFVNFLKFVHKYKISVLVLVLVCLVIVHFNTLVHPYMLADNRHYVFYVWNRFYGRFTVFKYLMVPVYLFSLFVMFTKLAAKRDISFLLFFIPCTSVVLIGQKLLEFRYFLIPFVLFRSQIRNTSLHSLIYEFVFYIVLNIGTFYLFFTREIIWENYDYPQRLIW